MLREFGRNIDKARIWLRPKPEKLRFVNWYLQHGCDLDCYFCKVPKQKTKIMDPQQRSEVLAKLRSLSQDNAMLSIFGGETTLKPDNLVGAVQDASKAGFFVDVITNGWGLTEKLIQQLSKAGLSYLAYSIDSDPKSPKRDLEKAMHLLSVARDFGIIPVVNTVLTSGTNLDDFRNLAKIVIENGIFLSPLICSPEVPDGLSSSASPSDTPSKEQLREIIPWLALKKLTTGRVATTFSYLWTLFNLKKNSKGITQSWHCASNFRGVDGKKKGRGYLTLDSDGFAGPCQEFPRQVNLLDIPPDQLSLRLLDPLFRDTTVKCPGCTYNCYIQEESISGLSTVAEFPSAIQLINVFRRKP